jgi:hypothetical protein
MEYYTYAYLREDRTPYYIGKGKGRRIYVKRKSGINAPKDKSRIIFLKQNLTEQESFKHEKYMIAVFGRKDLGTGILHNRTDGGEGTSNPSQETREKMSKSSKGNTHWLGKTHSIETKEKISQAKKGKNHPMFGKTFSAETKAKMSEAHKGNTACLGKTHSTETKAKMSEAHKKIPKSVKTKIAKITNSQKWICTETGYISTPAGLTHYQKAKGIDKSKRVRVS